MQRTYDRCREAIEHVLGGVVREENRGAGTIEATFGLIFSERLTCKVEPLGVNRSRVIIEVRRGAQSSAGPGSTYLDALSAAVQKET